jgi:RNA polymerase sigma-70 factor (ECF subfamily)
MIAAEARGAWQALERELRPFVARRVRAEADVDDVVQDVLLRIQRGLETLRDAQRFGPWVYRIARSAIIDHARATRRHGAPLSNTPDELPATTEDRDEARALAQVLAPFVALLPSPYREAITLTDLEGLPQKQAAQMLGISVSGMKSRVQRGRAKLRESIEACCEITLDVRHRIVDCEPKSDGKVPRGCCD